MLVAGWCGAGLQGVSWGNRDFDPVAELLVVVASSLMCGFEVESLTVSGGLLERMLVHHSLFPGVRSVRF